MTDEQISRLFQPFAQADTSTSRNYGGTGLGLSISRKFAQLLGGDVTIEESQIGVGTRFRTKISAGSLQNVNMLDARRASTVQREDQAVRPMTHNLTGQNILVAEDGPDNQRLISFFLKKAGAQVTIVENGKLALDAALAAVEQNNRFDCILMDMQMPVMSGYEATTALRDAGYTGYIIALTAHAMTSDRDKCLSAGCDEFANKPINRNELIQLIAEPASDRKLVTLPA